ncbi:uncharacterized protein CTHT_0010770 [Thermochaetoides thermophila DSM 1495]|uniref:Acetyl-CoA synthetase-like protein n=1 Tax=Chaetomium thermophilum (strain DSM 1495 / CBS 144.50 / IMI 039719) TaxID=759272 RepID=G0S0P6_CHATD|nr:hypothetical protein CTHT_0010770 [Thermochaetoides thermophila DSM 1495]EGS22606.1 hypothetical protein CTHT_0010770 [Thermochaetoides thermophila DSM 1495]
MSPLTQAYVGVTPGDLPLKNAFAFAFSQPFQTPSDFIPPEQVIKRVEPTRPIFVDNKTERALTLGQISRDSLAIASGLLALGLNPSDVLKLPPTPSCPEGPEIAPVILIQLPNCLPFAPIFFGVLASGLTATLASPALTADEIAWILQNSRPKAIITATTCLPAMKAALEKQADQTYFSSVPIYTVDVLNDTYPSQSTPSSKNDWKTILVPSPNKPKVNTTTSFDPSKARCRTAVILWSSGTSGRSKGVLISHHALNFSVASLWHDADYFNKTPGRTQRWLGYVPFYHVFGLCNVFLLSVVTGSTVYVMQAFHLETVLKAIRDRKVTYLHMAPPVAVMLAKAAVVEPYVQQKAFSSVVAGVTGGAPLGHEVVVEVYKRCGFRVRLGYGLSETCSTSLQKGLTEKDMHEGAGDTGSPHYGVEVMIADPNAGDDAYAKKQGEKSKVAGVDVEGEVLVRAPCLLLAYLPVGAFERAKAPDMSVTNDALTADGWFRTGDVGALDARGRLRITDRLKELIKVRAFQVAPAELEAVLCSSEEVADAGVIGIYDSSEATEWPRAFVVPRKGKIAELKREELEALAQRLKVLVEKRTTRYKWLMGGIVFVDQIPKSPSGKILRRVLKAGGKETKGVEVKLYEKKKRDVKL